jgi:hypothetical protein
MEIRHVDWFIGIGRGILICPFKETWEQTKLVAFLERTKETRKSDSLSPPCSYNLVWFILRAIVMKRLHELLIYFHSLTVFDET